VDLDLAQIRTFVTLAEELHFGRAAERLFLTQQALSKRIQRLERTAGEPLFARRHNAVELTLAGGRFLPHARRLLAMADETAVMLRPRTPSLRLDVWGPVQSPLRTLPELSAGLPGVQVELSMRRSMIASMNALCRNEIDTAFGRPYDLGRTWSAGLTHRPFRLEPMSVVVADRHPLAAAAEVTSDELRRTGLWWPIENGPAELTGWFQRYGAEHDVPITINGLNLGLAHFLAGLRADPSRIALTGVEWTMPPHVGVRVVPLRPVPHFLWSIVYREEDRNPALHRLVELISQIGPKHGWLDYRQGRDWLPAPDLADLAQDAPGDRY
jgi:DNA-binding transcriptional LysR family regulator